MLLDPGEKLFVDDYHTAGEPFRIVDLGPMEGSTALDRRSWAMEHLDDHRRFLVHEPRGHAGMYGGMVVPPNDADGDVGVVFFHKDGFSTACGHGTIAMATWAIETGQVDAPTDGEVAITVDVPSGRLPTVARMEGGRVASVRFTNVEAFPSARDLVVDTNLGPVTAQVSFGGAFYASVAIDDLDVACQAADVGRLVDLGRQVKAAMADHPAVVHPTDERLSGLYGAILHEDVVLQEEADARSAEAQVHQRNVTIFADGQVDRSPCGSGTCARLALLHADGMLGAGDLFVNEGVAGSAFYARVEVATDGGIIPSVEGSAYRTGTATFTLDPRDPVGLGFLLR
ncbi:MAG: proline racemase family protein [Actinomycetota bacterium]|nr:proline racemase family protein [Actinomycetota bacterium]